MKFDSVWENCYFVKGAKSVKSLRFECYFVKVIITNKFVT